MQAPPRRGAKQASTRSHRFEVYVATTCPNCKRFLKELHKKPLLANQIELKDAVAMKRQGTLYPWMSRVPTVIDFGDAVVTQKGKGAKKSEEMVYSGSEAFQFVQQWVGDVPMGIMSPRFRKSNYARGSMNRGGASLFMSPYSVTEDTFKGLEGQPIQIESKKGDDSISRRKQVDEQARQMAESASRRRR